VTESSTREMPAADVEAVAAVVTEYVQAWFAGDGNRMRAVLHPALAKRRAEEPGAASLDLHADPVDALVADTASGEGTVFEPVQEVTVLDVYRDIATAMFTCEPFVEYVHLGRFGDRWLIVNTLYVVLLDDANIA
jgi:Putative lumazine-binding